MPLAKPLSSDDTDHRAALEETGFWGRAGAGCIFIAKSTGRLLIPFRAPEVLNPNCWGTWGGAIDAGESPQDAVRREVVEEAGYGDHFELHLVYVFTSGTFQYYNFFAVVDHEFEPSVNWETADHGWFELHDLPSPLHFGWESMLADQECMTKIKQLIAK